MTHIELVDDKILGQGIQKLVVGRGVGIAEIVDRIDDAASHHMKPDAIDHAPREESVIGARNPICENLPAVLYAGGCGLAAQRPSEARLARSADW